ncbi:hypothetical protein, conserved [Eimeria brunetti]|uniref:tRNA/rRNA methyltransferase SpoU type domain-containing protein n=1 Tax=Eimeria brunetti TaxID=51314 RepID=U6LG41_9EIME|nr:hypothetical protein, conserved [Eimeria brunetti]
MNSNFPASHTLNSKKEEQTLHSGTTKGGNPPIDAADHRERLERRLQAQLRDGSRSRNVKRIEDPLAKHLLRVAGNPAYRDLRQSVIVSGKTLVCELLRNFPCRRLAVAGLHSYDDGCVAEMRMPEQAESFGDMRLLLCLGNIPASIGRTTKDQTQWEFSSSPDFLDAGTVGTLLRTAAALQWQGAWILPSCPDIFNPLTIRASQGALFWLPYRRGSVKELIELCKAKDLAICVPHEEGIPVQTAGIFEKREKRGVCLVLDSNLIDAAEVHRESQPSELATSEVESSDEFAAAMSSNEPKRGRRAEAGKYGFKPDVFLSLGSDVAPEGSMPLMHPITSASLLLYHMKNSHFPSLRGSPYLFSVKQTS